jgi:hypothetical protein
MYQFTVVVADKEDAEFMISSVRGVAETNHVKLEKEVELIELPKVILSKELRDKILSDEDFLSSYACNSFMYDGLEYDHARQLLEDDGDEHIVESYLACCSDDDVDVLKEIAAYPEFKEAVERVMKEDSEFEGEKEN